MNLFVKKFLDAYRMCDFYFISICLQKSLKSWLCSVPLPFLIKVSEFCRFLWVLSLMHIYLQKVPLDLVFLIDLFLWPKVCTKPLILNGSISVIYFFSADKTKVHRNLNLYDPRSTCLQKRFNFSSPWFFFFSFWRHNISIKLCQLLCKMMPKLLFPLSFFPNALWLWFKTTTLVKLNVPLNIMFTSCEFLYLILFFFSFWRYDIFVKISIRRCPNSFFQYYFFSMLSVYGSRQLGWLSSCMNFFHLVLSFNHEHSPSHKIR